VPWPLEDLTDDEATAARLLRQADQLESRARALRYQASDLSYEAMDLRTEAENLTRHRVTVKGAKAPDPLDRRVLGVLEGAGALSMTDLADHLGVASTRLRGVLGRLEEDGKIVRRGIKRGTRYLLASEAETDAAPNVHAFQSYETLVRDAAVKLDTFGIVDMQRELSDLSEATIRRWVRKLEDRGVIEAARDGVAKVYAYVPPATTAPASRPRRESPEKEAVRLATPSPFPRRGRAVAGAGRGERAGSSIVNELLREVRPHGLDIKRTAHKIVFVRDGVEIANCSTTPGASSLKDTRRNLQKAGVPVKS
jgi:DNA-binding Lrp family transcriptional regulator